MKRFLKSFVLILLCAVMCGGYCLAVNSSAPPREASEGGIAFPNYGKTGDFSNIDLSKEVYPDWKSFHGYYADRSVSFVDENTGYMLYAAGHAGGNGASLNDIWKTDDGGESWELVSTDRMLAEDRESLNLNGRDLGIWLTDMYFADELHGVCLCDYRWFYGTETVPLMFTEDGGKTWVSYRDDKELMNRLLPQELLTLGTSTDNGPDGKPMQYLLFIDLETGYGDKAKIIFYYRTEQYGPILEKSVEFSKDTLSMFY